MFPTLVLEYPPQGSSIFSLQPWTELHFVKWWIVDHFWPQEGAWLTESLTVCSPIITADVIIEDEIRAALLFCILASSDDPNPNSMIKTLLIWGLALQKHTNLRGRPVNHPHNSHALCVSQRINVTWLAFSISVFIFLLLHLCRKLSGSLNTTISNQPRYVWCL